MSANEPSGRDACKHMLLQISRSLDGDLCASEQAELATHLVQCADCRLLAAELSAANRLFQALTATQAARAVPKAAFTKEVMTRLHQEAATGDLLAFSRLVAQDPDLQRQFRPATTEASFVELFVNVGWQRGYRFAQNEVVSLLTARRAANDELSDAQLDAVVGGVGPVDAALQAFLGDVLQNFFKPKT